jgi:hypothetical protein
VCRCRGHESDRIISTILTANPRQPSRQGAATGSTTTSAAGSVGHENDRVISARYRCWPVFPHQTLPSLAGLWELTQRLTANPSAEPRVLGLAIRFVGAKRAEPATTSTWTRIRFVGGGCEIAPRWVRQGWVTPRHACRRGISIRKFGASGESVLGELSVVAGGIEPLSISVYMEPWEPQPQVLQFNHY